jgi:predicted transcriptional regulator
MRIALGEREAQLMEVLWDCGPSTVSEVQEQLRDTPAYTTILTMLRKLEAKGYIDHSEDGRAHRYHALIERTAAQQGALDTLITRLFKGSADALLLHMVSKERISAKQVEKIEARLRKANSIKKERP